jgi:hypothetical protein
MAPTDVTVKNERRVASTLYPKKPKKVNWKLKVGDQVRLRMAGAVFREGYVGSWTGI